MTPEEFRRIRKAARMTQAQMATRLGVSRLTISNWEAGRYAIPETALDTLTERGIAPAPAEHKPIIPATHPELYDPSIVKGGFTRNHKHPHWFARNSRLAHYLSQAQRDAFEQMIAYPDDIEKLKWDGDKAVAFMVNLGVPETAAKDIAADAGFKVTIDRDPYLVAQQAFFREHPLATIEQFLDAHPEFKPAEPEMAGETDPAIRQALDAVFNLNQ